MPIVTTKSARRLVFRPPHRDDFEALYTFVKTLEVEDTFIRLNPQEPVSLSQENTYFNNLLRAIEDHKQVHTYVFDQHKMIGSCGIEEQGKRKHHVGLLGIALLKEYRNDGIGKQLLSYTIDQAQHHLRIRLVVLEYFTINHLAGDLYRQLGFIPAGVIPQAALYQGKYIDEAIMYKPLSTNHDEP